MTYATAQDLVDRWRPLSAEEMARAAVLLEDASGEVDAEFRRRGLAVADELATGEVTEDDLRVVACRMVQRAMTSPVGVDGGGAIESSQIGVGPFQESVRYANPMGDVYLTKADRRRLGLGQQAFTVPFEVPATTGTYWWE